MNKSVLITGAAKGLGRSMAIEFAHRGYDVTITYNKSKIEAEDLLEHLKQNYEGNFAAYEVNLLDEEACSQLVKKFTRLDVLINNASFNEDKNYDEFTKEDFLNTYVTNVVAPYLLANSFKELLKTSHGSIVNIASTNGIDTMYKESIPYDAAKAALINLTKNLSVALAPEIRVNALAPGWIETEATSNMDSKFKSIGENSCLLHRFANPEEIAKTAYFIASEDSSYMTGSIVRIDGGNYYGNR